MALVRGSSPLSNPSPPPFASPASGDRTLAQAGAYSSPITTDHLDDFEKAVTAQAPPGAVVVGSSISPDSKYGAALTLLPTAGDYLMDDVFIRVGDRWETYGGGSAGICWTSLDDESETGVLRYGDEAPAETSAAWIRYEGQDYRVPVRHGHFLFVAWRTVFAEDPSIIRFE